MISCKAIVVIDGCDDLHGFQTCIEKGDSFRIGKMVPVVGTAEWTLVLQKVEK